MSELSDDRDYWHKNTARLEQENDNLQKEVERLKIEAQRWRDRDSFIFDSVGETHLIISRADPNGYDKQKFDSVSLPARVGKLLSDLSDVRVERDMALASLDFRGEKLSAAQKRIEEAEKAGMEYIKRTDPLISCAAWLHGGYEVPQCGECRACLQNRIKKLESSLEEMTRYRDNAVTSLTRLNQRLEERDLAIHALNTPPTQP